MTVREAVMMVGWKGRFLPMVLGVLALTLTIAPGRAPGEQVPVPKGAVILTIAGDIAHANRAASHPKRDGFLKYHEITFDRAFVFDRAMLEEFPLQEITAQPPQFAAPRVFRGPLLRDVLKAIGAEGASIRTRALDGFAVDLSADEIAAKDWILATSAGGKAFGIGDQGPLWLMHTPSAIKVAEAEEQRWPWALFYIEVKK